MPPKRRVGRPRKRRSIPKRRMAGGQLGFLTSVLGPLVAKEVAKTVVPLIGKKIRGKGITLPGGALKLAGQGPRQRRRRAAIRSRQKAVIAKLL